MSYLDLYKKRINAKGRTIQERIITEQRENFDDYLARTPNKKKILIDDVEYNASILFKKDAENRTHVIILTTLDVPIKQGTLIFWNESYWLTFITEEQKNETHFKGELLKSNLPLKWIDKYGIERNTYGFVSGNTSGDLQYKTSSTGFGATFSFIFASMSAKIVMIIPRTDITEQTKEEDQYVLNNKKWRLTEKDDFSYPGLIALLLERISVDPIDDDMENQLAQISRLDSWKLEVKNGNVFNMNIGQEREVNINIYENNNLVIKNPPKLIWIIEDDSLIEAVDGKIKALNNGNTKIRIAIEDCIEIFTEIEVNIDSAPLLSIHYSITGNESIKNGLSATYTAVRTYDGIEDSSAVFKFSLKGSPFLASLVKIDNHTCKITANSQGKNGKVLLVVDDGLNKQEKTIEIDSFFV